MTTIDYTVEEVFNLYDKFGEADYIGEAVSQIEHMSQSAQLAIAGNHPDEIILAAFFHDIGHLCFFMPRINSMDGFGVKRHEIIGSEYLISKGFPEIIAKLVRYHVQAKRYLTFKYPDYYKNLSSASKKTLSYQGGIMNEYEAKNFESDPLFSYSILLRQWDEQAKEPNMPLVDLDFLKEKARKVLYENLLSKAS